MRSVSPLAVTALLFGVTLTFAASLFAAGHGRRAQAAALTTPSLPECVAFTPYLEGYDPEFGPHPPPSVIGTLLDTLVLQSNFRCIQVYGVLNGLDFVVTAAAQRGIAVVLVIWLDTDASVNDTSITKGIEVARSYPATVVRISCGSEVRTRNQLGFTGPIAECVARLRAAGVSQPIGSIDTWWVWCNQQQPCHREALASQLDWIGVNVYPWWENKFSPLYPCTSAQEAPSFILARLQEVAALHAGKRLTLTEYGWPAGPNGYSEVNERTGQQCGVASEQHQQSMVNGTRALVEAAGFDNVIFAAFREGPWKARVERSAVGRFWGQCAGAAPYLCTTTLVDCQPRPGVTVRTAFDGSNRLIASVTTGGGVLREVRFGDPTVSPASPSNALVDIPGGPSAMSGSFSYALPTLTRELTFSVRQRTPNTPVHVALVVADDCGAWQTFVGVGASAWPSTSAGQLSWVAPSPTPTPAPACAPRPPVAIATNQHGPGRLTVQVRAGAGRLREVRFVSVSNARIEIDALSGRREPFTYSLPNTREQLTFMVQREAETAPMTVALVVVDGCGSWQTIVGSGTGGL